MDEHPLDRPIWNSLLTSQKSLASGTGLARRYPADVSPFADVSNSSAESLQALSEMIRQTGLAIVARPDPLVAMDGLRTAWCRRLLQMIFSGQAPADEPNSRIEPLEMSDAPAMLSLARMTRPGPFEARTIAMGNYWGIKEKRNLIAMAGERLRQTGYTEISGVCTHPDYQGQGLAKALSLHAVREIIRQGRKPYLHAFEDARIAISLYKSLGFRQRASLVATALEPT